MYHNEDTEVSISCHTNNKSPYAEHFSVDEIKHWKNQVIFETKNIFADRIHFKIHILFNT